MRSGPAEVVSVTAEIGQERRAPWWRAEGFPPESFPTPTRHIAWDERKKTKALRIDMPCRTADGGRQAQESSGGSSAGSFCSGSWSAAVMEYDSPSQRPRSIVLHRLLQNGYSGHARGTPGMAWPQIEQDAGLIGDQVLGGEGFGSVFGASVGVVPVAPASLAGASLLVDPLDES